MFALEHMLDHLLPFGVTLSRFAGIFIFAPIVGSLAIPPRVKVLLTFGMTMIVYPTIDHASVDPGRMDMVNLIFLVAGEAMIGLAIGLLAALPILSVQMGGLLMGQQMGLGLANVFNPAIDTEGDVAGQMLLYMALGAFLLMGGLEIMFIALVESFAHVPLGGMAVGQAPLDLLVGLIASGYELAMRIAAPVLCILFLETLVAGFIMKTVPQINVLSFGFPVKIMMGLSVMIASLIMLSQIISVDIEDALILVLEWVRSL